MDHADQRDVVVVVCEGVVLLDLAGPVQVFTGAGGYRIRLASLDGRPVRTDTGVVLGADLALSEVDSPVDTIVVPGPTPDLLDGFPPALIVEVRRLGAAARRVTSVCTGAFLLAEAGLLAGRHPGEDYDTELVFLICVLHDMGLTEEGNTDQRFEVAGADLAARFLEANGVTDRRVDTVWDAIALHTTQHLHESPVFRRRRPNEIGIAQTGIGIDLTGPDDPDLLPPGFAERVHARYPRLGGCRALTDAIVAQALANPLKAPPMTLPGEILHQRHPSLPYLTWDMILDANSWAD